MPRLSSYESSLRTIYLLYILSTVRLIPFRLLNSLIIHLHLILAMDFFLVRSQRENLCSDNEPESPLYTPSKVSLSLNTLSISNLHPNLHLSLSPSQINLYLSLFSLDLFPRVNLRTVSLRTKDLLYQRHDLLHTIKGQ